YNINWDYKKKQWIKKGEMLVALKCLDNSHKFEEFLQEVKSHINIKYGKCTIWYYGLTNEPNNNTTGFKAIDKAGLVYVDLHMGTILHDDHEGTKIIDLRLSLFVNNKNEKKQYMEFRLTFVLY
ncbi:15944_t:CDS:2, partial [Gigaspora margarita]